MDQVEGYFLGGDSFPADQHVEAALVQRLAPSMRRFVTQDEVDPAHRTPCRDLDLENRRRRLADLAASRASVVLFGRSSGARIATLQAARAPIRAVICFSYPFRCPGRPIEPDRFLHLAMIRTPTLIIQGERDAFSGGILAETYILSEFVVVRPVAGVGHDLRLSERQWDVLAAEIARFIHRTSHADRQPVFDEAYYLRRYPDIAAEIGAGRFDSAAQHYREHGRLERRSARPPVFT